MSGGGSSGGNALMTIAAVAAVAATGGAALGVIGPGLLAATAGGAAVAGAVGSKLNADAATKDLKKATSGLLKPITQPKVAPTATSADVAKAEANSLVQLQQRSGRQSTLLTNQSAPSNQFGG